MKQEYSLTSIWYWSLNSIAFVVATFGTVQAILPSQPSYRVETPPQPVKEPFNLSFNLYKPVISTNNPQNPNFRLTLLPVASAESQKCQVFSCLPPNPFRNDDNSLQNDSPKLNLQQDDYPYASSNIKSYQLDKLNTNISQPLKITDIFIPVTPIQQVNTSIVSQQTKSQTNSSSSGIFSHTYESIPLPDSRDVKNPSPNLSPMRGETLNSLPSPEGKGVEGLGITSSFPHDGKSQIPLPQTPAVTPEAKKVPVTLAGAVYLALASGASQKLAIMVKTPRMEPGYTWNETDNTGKAIKRDFKLSLIKDTDSKIARLNELIKRQDLRNTLNGKITDVVLAYRKLLQAQEKFKIAEEALSIIKAQAPVNVQNQVNLTNHRVALLAARNQVEIRRLELVSILGLDRKTQIVASDVPVIKSIPLDFHKLQQIALENQPNYLRNQLKFQLSKLKKNNEPAILSQLDTQLQNTIRDINSIYSQLDGARQVTKLAQQLVDVEQQKGKGEKVSEFIGKINDLTKARNNEVDLTFKYLSGLTHLDFLLGTTLDTWQISIQ